MMILTLWGRDVAEDTMIMITGMKEMLIVMMTMTVIIIMWGRDVADDTNMVINIWE